MYVCVFDFSAGDFGGNFMADRGDNRNVFPDGLCFRGQTVNQLVVYVVGLVIAGLGGLSGLYFSLRGQSTRLEHRLTRSEEKLESINDRLDRDREDGKEFRERIENALSEQTRMLRELSEQIKK